MLENSPGEIVSNDQLGDSWKDALCPGCGNPASGLGSAGGWLFVCTPCGDARWGHPQMHYGDGGAAGVLHDAETEQTNLAAVRSKERLGVVNGGRDDAHERD